MKRAKFLNIELLKTEARAKAEADASQKAREAARVKFYKNKISNIDHDFNEERDQYNKIKNDWHTFWEPLK